MSRPWTDRSSWSTNVGGIYDFYRTDHVKFGIGGLVSKYALPDTLKPLYGSDPTSGMVFLRLKVI